MKKILFAFLSLLISVPIIASAQNADVDPQGSSTCVTIKNNLRFRMTDAQTGGDVSDLQDFLQANGYLKVSPSGYMGLLTVKGVRAFQSDNGISPTGYVGPLTRAKIQTVSCGGNNTSPTPSNQNGTTDHQFRTVPGCASGAIFSSTTGARCQSTANSNSSNVSQSQNKQAATITGIQSASNPMGTVDANHKASIYGTGLSGTLTIKIGNQEPQTVTTTGTSDTYAEFIVPQRSQASVASVTVTNSSGVASNYYQININPDNINSTTPSTKPYITILSPNGGESYNTGAQVPVKFITNLTDQQTRGMVFQLYKKTSDSFGKMYVQSITSNWLGGSPYNWTIPTSLESGSYYIYTAAQGSREGIDPIDFSDNYFTINNQSGNANTTTQPSITITSPVVQGNYISINDPLDINWTSKGGSSVAVYLMFSDGGACYLGSVASDGGNLGHFSFVPVNQACPNINKVITAGGEYKIGLFLHNGDNNERGIAQSYSGNFILGTVSNQQITVGGNTTASCTPTNGTYRSPVNNTTSDGNPLVSFVSPSGGEKLCVGKNYRITWDSTNVDKVSLGYSFGEGSLNWFQGNAANNIPNTGSYDWNVNIGNTTNTNLKLYIIGYHTGVGSKASYSNSVTVSQ